MLGQSSVDNALYWDNIGQFTYKKGLGTYNQYLNFNSNNGVVSCYGGLLDYYHSYQLWFSYYNNGNFIGSTEPVYYYVCPVNYNGTSGELNNDNPTNVDFDFINSIEYLMNDNSGNTEYITNNKIGSGDNLFGINYYDNDNFGLGTFIRNFITNFYNTLIDYEDITIDFGWLGIYSSSDFTTPNNNVYINFVSLLINVLLCIGSISFFFKTILNISTLNVDKIVKDDEDLGLF